MVWTRLMALAGLYVVLSVAVGEAAGPARKGKDTREQTFRGVITDVNQGRNRRDEAGSITVRGHDERGKARPGKGQVGKGQPGKGKGQRGAVRQGETMRFLVADGTLVVRNSQGKGNRGPGKVGINQGKGNKAGKGRGQMLTIRQLREGDIVEVSHVGNRAMVVRVVGHMDRVGDGKGKGKGVQKKK